MKFCAVCREIEADHHQFQEEAIPDECQCAPGSWIAPVRHVCGSFAPDRTNKSYCARCSHDAACHTKELEHP